MKAEMSEDGVITIRPESSVEAYALRRWVGANLIEALVEPVGAVGQWDSSKLLIDARWPQESDTKPENIRHCLVCNKKHHVSQNIPCPNMGSLS